MTNGLDLFIMQIYAHVYNISVSRMTDETIIYARKTGAGRVGDTKLTSKLLKRVPIVKLNPNDFPRFKQSDRAYFYIVERARVLWMHARVTSWGAREKIAVNC